MEGACLSNTDVINCGFAAVRQCRDGRAPDLRLLGSPAQPIAYLIAANLSAGRHFEAAFRVWRNFVSTTNQCVSVTNVSGKCFEFQKEVHSLGGYFHRAE